MQESDESASRAKWFSGFTERYPSARYSDYFGIWVLSTEDMERLKADPDYKEFERWVT